MRTFDSGRYLADLMAELDRAAISLRIAEARDKRAGLIQTEIADLLGVHWRTIQDWESPKNPTVPWDRLSEIAEATGVTKEWLLHGMPPQAPPGDLEVLRPLLERAIELLETLVEAPPARKAPRKAT